MCNNFYTTNRIRIITLAKIWIINKKSLKIEKEEIRSRISPHIQRNKKNRTKGQTIIYKVLHRKLGRATRTPLKPWVISVVLQLLQTRNQNKCICCNNSRTIRAITKLPNTEQSSKGKGKTHKSTNRQNQSTTGKLGKPQRNGGLNPILRRQTSRFHYG